MEGCFPTLALGNGDYIYCVTVLFVNVLLNEIGSLLANVIYYLLY